MKALYCPTPGLADPSPLHPREQRTKSFLASGGSMTTQLLYEKKEDSKEALVNLTFSLRFPSPGLEKKLIFSVFPELKERSLDTAHNSTLLIYPQRLYKEIHKVFQTNEIILFGSYTFSYICLNVSAEHLVPVAWILPSVTTWCY